MQNNGPALGLDGSGCFEPLFQKLFNNGGLNAALLELDNRTGQLLFGVIENIVFLSELVGLLLAHLVFPGIEIFFYRREDQLVPVDVWDVLAQRLAGVGRPFEFRREVEVERFRDGGAVGKRSVGRMVVVRRVSVSAGVGWPEH